MDLSLKEAEILDPHPDIHTLFCHYNTLYFADALGACILTWSSERMTLWAGDCCYDIGGICEILLSEPLLKFRSSADVKNTLLHEMIHAYLWIKNKNKDHSDHGPSFQKLMNEINSSSVIDHQRPDDGYNITIDHSFHDEVDNNRVHHWLCQSCGDVIKSAMNREPSPSDCIAKVGHHDFCGNPSCHWHLHKMSCGGDYEKIAEPPGYKNRKSSKGKHDFRGEKFEVSARSTRKGAEKAPKGVKIKDKSDVLEANTIENFYPIVNEANGNTGSTSPSGDDFQKNFQFDELQDPHESNFSTRATRKNAWTGHNDGRINDKSDVPKSNTIEKFCPITSKANGSLESGSSSDYGLQKNLNIDELRTSDEETWNPAVPALKAELRGNHTLRKKRKFTHVGGKKTRKCENYTVIIQWKNWYANEEAEDEEATESLHNKRTERRKKQKLPKNPTGVVLKDEPIDDAPPVSSSSADVSAFPFKHTLGSEGEDRPSTSHVNSRKQKSDNLVEDDTEALQANLNDCISNCHKVSHTRESANHSATSHGLVDVSGDCKSVRIAGGVTDVVDLSDG